MEEEEEIARLRFVVVAEMGAEAWRVVGGWRVAVLSPAPSEGSGAREPRRERDSCCEIIDMDDWRGGLAR